MGKEKKAFLGVFLCVKKLNQTTEIEEEYIRRMCYDILKFKPDVVITEKGCSDLAQHFFVKNGVAALRRFHFFSSFFICLLPFPPLNLLTNHPLPQTIIIIGLRRLITPGLPELVEPLL